MSLIHRWKLNGSGIDSVGTNHGTDGYSAYWSTYSREGRGSLVVNPNYGGVLDFSFIDMFSYTDFTISIWVYTDEESDYEVIFCESSSSNTTSAIRIDKAPSSLKCRYFVRKADNTNLVVDLTEADIADNKWHHMVLVDENGTYQMYVDGKADSGCSGSYTRADCGCNQTEIGYAKRNSDAFYFMWGRMEDLRIYDHALSAAEVQSLYLSYIPRPWDFPAHRWKLDGNSTDFMGSNDGSDTSVTYETSSPDPKEGSHSAYSNGSTTKISLSNTNLFQYTNFSLSFWVNMPDIYESRAVFVESNSADNNPGYWVFIGEKGNIAVYIRKADGTVLEYTSGSIEDIDDETWHHIVITDANGTLRVFLDGAAEPNFASASYTRASLGTNTATFFLWTRPSPNYNFTGNLDDFRIYDFALTGAQVKALYESYNYRWSY